ncbi:MAG: hypothetical protein GDA53_06720 [Rhodobacteraceae bacterium]|nr:hypothetical protein [Paracoccaceae bacterium]
MADIEKVKAALHGGFRRQHPGIPFDTKGYVGDFRHTLLPQVLPRDFEQDLLAGDGNELATKFRAIHSSSGLAVNCLAPFRRRMSDMVIPAQPAFDTLRFEHKCPTGLRGTPPNLDVVLSGIHGVVGIESKLTEYLARENARALDTLASYEKGITDWRRNQGYFAALLHLRECPDHYRHLHAAQLIKHAFGLARSFPRRPVTLLYLFWEPANPGACSVCAAHRKEVEEFRGRVAGSTPAFEAMSYPELWHFWQGNPSAPPWLHQHVDALKRRYLVTI